ncbi:NUDIX domain-containing protein [Nonomuraea sp. NPDC049695]|uniref:NUDIX domain-containing protein n=1 Tax=Nonomuraea sp. NPDC049695 TaxID=3154734 RepID=UPI003440E4E1
MTKLPELYVAVDVEADGPIPGPYSMISLGMAVVGRPELTFYTELRPISDDFVPEALAVSGLDRDRLLREAPPAEEAMAAAARWINGLRRIGRPVFLGAPAVFDGMFVHWYFVRFLGKSPFNASGSGLDLRSYWMGLTGCEWVSSRKAVIKQQLKITDLRHTHHAGEDAVELAHVFDAVLKSRGSDVMQVVAAAVVENGRLLVVSKNIAPEVFYLPGGKPEEGESAEETLARELNEELGVSPLDMDLLGHVDDMAVLEGVPMRLTVFVTRIDGPPAPAAELAAMGWTDGRDSYIPRLAPAIRNQVLPMLAESGVFGR